MPSRKKKFSPFHFNKRQQQKWATLGFIIILVFAFWIYRTYQNNFSGRHPHKKITAHKSAGSRPITARSQAFAHTVIPSPLKPKAEPIVYYKPTASVPFTPEPPRRISSAAPKIAFVIDDIGNTGAYIPEIEKLGRDVTYAILPLLPHSGQFDQLSLRTGADVILHLPLESYKGTIPGPGLITTSMPDDYVLEELNRNLNSVPHRIGVNNHMGSKGTSDPRIMDLVLSELKKRNLIYLDSRTTSQSVAPLVAQQLGIDILRRDEFLDNEDTIPAIKQEITRLAAQARRRGYAVGIGHYRLNTLKVLQEVIPQLKREGFEIVNLRELLAYKKSARV